jgi:hypothetical protein
VKAIKVTAARRPVGRNAGRGHGAIAEVTAASFHGASTMQQNSQISTSRGRSVSPYVRFCRKWLGASLTRCCTIRNMSDLITKLVPILHVQDPDAERRFYEQLGLRTTYEDPEYLGFIAVGNDAVEFGLSRHPGAEPAGSGLTWAAWRQ